MTEPPLAYMLLRASRWFDRQLLGRLEQAGWPRLSPAQSVVFPHLSPEGPSTSALARRLGVTRQSAHELVSGLMSLGLVRSHHDPGAGRQRRLLLTPRGQQLAADAARILAELEEELRTGAGGGPGIDTDALRLMLSADILSTTPES